MLVTAAADVGLRTVGLRVALSFCAMSTHASDSLLLVRLAKVERNNRRLGVALAATLAVLVLPAFTSHDQGEVEAHAVKLLDKAGKVVGKWSVDGKDLPKLELFDGGEKPRLEMGITTDDVFVNLSDRKGLKRLGLGIDAGGRPHVLLCTSSGRPSLHLAVNDAGQGNLIAFDQEGMIVAGLGIGTDGKPWVRPIGAARADDESKEPKKAKASGEESPRKDGEDAAPKADPTVKR